MIAGGCFWGVQAVFQHVKGVSNAVSGYAGGTQQTARYDVVSSGATAHAEAVRITYDPKQISYGRILQIFFSVAHDPTQLDRQGPDTGKQYRSAIFPENAEQEKVAKAYIDQLNKAGHLRRSDRDQSHAGRALLSGGGLSPEFPEDASVASLHRVQRPAEDRKP